jgi:predicted helicase
MTGLENLALCTNRQVNGSFRHVFCTTTMVSDCALSTASKERTYILPLYLLPEEGSLKLHDGTQPNLACSFLCALASAIQDSQEGPFGLPSGLTPNDIFNYPYAVLHSINYRRRYEEFLKIDFPRVPLPQGFDLFRELAHFIRRRFACAWKGGDEAVGFA